MRNIGFRGITNHASEYVRVYEARPWNILGVPKKRLRVASRMKSVILYNNDSLNKLQTTSNRGNLNPEAKRYKINKSIIEIYIYIVCVRHSIAMKNSHVRQKSFKGQSSMLSGIFSGQNLIFSLS